MSKPKGYADIADLPEDERIKIIGETVTQQGAIVGVCVDSTPGKADRYKRKLLARFPNLVIIDTTDGPVKDVVTIRMGPRQS